MTALLRSHGIAGWKLHPADVPGRPDIYFPALRVAIFLDGCFWHACKRCFQMPVGNRRFWRDKILANVRRDQKVSRVLRKSGVRVLRLWEHDLERKNPRVHSVLALLKSLPPTAAGAHRLGAPR
jgi:DNA mismatch endonuclease, patch repair protein